MERRDAIKAIEAYLELVRSASRDVAFEGDCAVELPSLRMFVGTLLPDSVTEDVILSVTKSNYREAFIYCEYSILVLNSEKVESEEFQMWIEAINNGQT